MGNLKVRKCCVPLLAAALFLGVMAPGLSQAQTLNVDGGATLNVPPNQSNTTENIGVSSTGTLIQTGGSNTVTVNLSLGVNPGSSGTYNLGGTTSYLQAGGTEYVGYSGTGTFTQTGGTNTAAGPLVLGYNAGSSGTYNLSGGSLSVLGGEFVGDSGNGAFTQSGGTNTVAGNLFVGFFAPSASGTYNLSGGSLSVSGDESVGSNCTFTQSGGANTVGGTLYVGYFESSYNLSGGYLSVGGNEYVGNTGTGIFTQSGGTNVVGGTLYLGYLGGSSGSYNLSGGSLWVDGNEYVGVSGSGTFTQSGGTNVVGGTLYPGAAGYTLSGGSLWVSGVSGSLNNNGGTVNMGLPGAGSGTTLNILDNYTQSSSGTLDVRIFSTSSYDNMSVTGAAALGGKVDVFVAPVYLPNGTVFQIIQAGSISGTLTPVVTDSLTLFFTVKDPTPAILDLVLTRDYTNAALDLNWKQTGVGAMLNGVAPTATGDLANVLNVIDLLPTAGAVGNALQQISPDKVQALSDLSLTVVGTQTQSLSRRMTNLRYDIDDMGGAGGAGSYVLNGWSLFVDPSGFAGTRSTTMDRTGYDLSGEGFTMGMDRKVADNLLVGLATGYTHATASFSGSGGSADLDLVPISLYAAYMPQSFYIFGTAGYALNLYDLDRLISFSSPGGSVSRAASSSPMGNLFNFYGEAGYDVKFKPLVVTPIVSMGYSHLGIDSFTESGAGSLDLNVSSQSIDSAQSGVGVRIAAPAASDLMKAVPQVFATWQHEFCDGKQDINASLINTPGASTFGWETEGGNRNFANVGGDLSMFVRKDLSVHFSYNAEVGGGDITHIFSAGLRWQF